jgi:Carboxypeptidase regulatory-like domain
MIKMVQERLGSSRQRGFWLRCFLRAVLSLAITLPLNAQIEVQRPLRVSHVHGYVVNLKGKPVSGAQVELAREGASTRTASTSSEGEFVFIGVSGRYFLRVREPKTAIAAREIVVGKNLFSVFHREPIYVVLMPGGACADCESPIVGSRKQLNRIVHENIRN